ncbi:MAG: hypothetical protein JXL85_02105 [Bacilli bacterium]|nr:hypothetical protein [Bacilli bacterium]
MKKLLIVFAVLITVSLLSCEARHMTYPDPLFETYLSPYEIDDLDNSGIRITGKMEYHFPSTTTNFRRDWNTDYDFDVYYHEDQQIYMDYYFLRSRYPLEQRDQVYTYNSWYTDNDSVIERLCVEHFCDFTTLDGDNTEDIFRKKTKDLINLPYFVLPTYGDVSNYDETARIIVPLNDFIEKEQAFIDQFLRVYDPYSGTVQQEEYSAENANVSIYVDQIDETTVRYLLESDYYYYDETNLYRFKYTVTLSLTNDANQYKEDYDISYCVYSDESIDEINYVYPDIFDTTINLLYEEGNYLAFNLSSGSYEVRIRNINSGSTYESTWYDADMNVVDVTNIEEDGIYYIKIVALDDSPPSVIFKIFPMVY